MKKVQNNLIESWFFIGLCFVTCLQGPPSLGEIIDEEPSAKPISPQMPMETNSVPKKSTVKEPIQKKPAPQDPGVKAGTAPVAPKGGTPKPNQSAPKEKLPVHFSSQGLKGLREKGLVELVQDVVVTQGEFKLEADNAQVYFGEQSKEVHKVVAVGQPVKITNVDPNTGERIEASGNQVLFNNEERLVFLEGNAKIKKGSQSTIKGKKISYELDSGWIKADRVAGEVSPQP